MFKLLRWFRMVIQFSRAAGTFLGETERLTEQHEDEGEAEAIRLNCRRMVILGTLFPLFYGLVVPVAVPWTAFALSEQGDPHAAGMATALGLLFSLGTMFFYVFVGVAAGCLFVPDAFFDSPVGQQWLKLIGSKSHTGARVICMVTVWVGLAVAAGLALLQVHLVNAPPPRR